MSNNIYTPLQIREVFHLEFLRWWARKIDAKKYALKGGVNLRFFFKSIRYSEDMDIDASGVRVENIKKAVMEILQSPSFVNTLKTFGIANVIPPNLERAKQTDTTQRFKIHLITPAGEDFFTKIQFSKRDSQGTTLVQPISDTVLRAYKSAPVVVPHYDFASAVVQKIHALACRSITQARDIFDLYLLSSQYTPSSARQIIIEKSILTKAQGNIFEINDIQFRDSVTAYLSFEDQSIYTTSSVGQNHTVWDEIKLRVSKFIDEMRSINHD